jgi:hypothetical protein
MPSKVFIFLISWPRDEGGGSDIAGGREGMEVGRVVVVRLKREVKLGETVTAGKSRNCNLGDKLESSEISR